MSAFRPAILLLKTSAVVAVAQRGGWNSRLCVFVSHWQVHPAAPAAFHWFNSRWRLRCCLAEHILSSLPSVLPRGKYGLTSVFPQTPSSHSSHLEKLVTERLSDNNVKVFLKCFSRGLTGFSVFGEIAV